MLKSNPLVNFELEDESSLANCFSSETDVWLPKLCCDLLQLCVLQKYTSANISTSANTVLAQLCRYVDFSTHTAPHTLAYVCMCWCTEYSAICTSPSHCCYIYAWLNTYSSMWMSSCQWLAQQSGAVEKVLYMYILMLSGTLTPSNGIVYIFWCEMDILHVHSGTDLHLQCRGHGSWVSQTPESWLPPASLCVYCQREMNSPAATTHTHTHRGNHLKT